MQLIIDIPDKVIAHIRSAYGHGYKGLYDEDESIIVDSIYNAIEFQKMIEEIKTEAEELIEHCDSDYDFEEIYGIRLVVGILDNRLSELKGENNE